VPGATRRSITLVTTLVLSAATLAACSSALTPDYSDRGTRYTDGLLARAVMDGSYKGSADGIAKTPTQVGGVRETAPIGAQGQPAEAIVPGTAPGGVAATSPEETARRQALLQQGLRAAQLYSDEEVITLSLQDAIARTVQNSLAIKVEAYNPGIRASQVVEAEAAFDPLIFGQSNWTNNDEPTPFSTINTQNGQLWQNQIGIRQLLPSGGTAQIATGATYRHTPSTINNIPTGLDTNPSWLANIGLQVSQPLLRGFGTEVTQANIYLAQRDQRISLATFKRQVITTVADVEEAYWNLVNARTNVDILERLVRASDQTYQTILLRRDLDATRASINQAKAALELRQAELLRARATYRTASDRLKSLINDPALATRSNALIVPADRPVAEPLVYNIADVIETALRQRPELQEARLQVERADIVVRVARNDLLPKLNLVAGVQTNGLDEGYDAAFGSTISPGHYIDYSAGITLEFPIGNRAPEAAYRRRQLERGQAVTSMMNVAEKVVLDVKQQLREVLTSYEEIAFRERVRLAAGDELEGIIDLEEIRARSPEFLQLLLDSQSRLATAEQNLTQTLVNYNIAIARLEQAKGTLLEFNRISLDRPPATRNDSDFGKIRFMGSTYLTK
jgi:HAE1 family hydrophobic/amphiphilic exporter-1